MADYKSKFTGEEIEYKITTANLFIYMIPSDFVWDSDCFFTKEEFESMLEHNKEVYSLMEKSYKEKHFVPYSFLVEVRLNAENNIQYNTNTSCSHNIHAREMSELTMDGSTIGAGYEIGDIIFTFSGDYLVVMDSDFRHYFCKDGTFYYMYSGGGLG